MNRFQKDEKIVNIHSTYVWLPQTQTWMYNLIRHLPADVEPHVVCERTENLDQFGMPNIHSLSDASFSSYLIRKLLTKAGIRDQKAFTTGKIRELKAGILHSHFGHIGWENLSSARKTRVKHVVSFYGFDVSYLPALDPLWHVRYKELFRESDCICCEGSFMAESLVRLGCPREKIRLQHLGIEISRIRFTPRTWDPSKTLRVLIAASFQEKKGIPYALEALGQLQHDMDISITIIGDANEEERSKAEKKKIMDVIRKHGLEAKTRLLSYQPYSVLFNEAYRHHIFLSPSVTALDSDTEGGLPVSILEMAATGMIVISSRHCDIPDVIRHRKTGILAEERDVAGIISGIRYLAENPGQWHPMITAARNHIEEEYDAQKQGLRLAGIYRELTANA